MIFVSRRVNLTLCAPTMLLYVLLALCAVVFYVFNSRKSDYWKKRNVKQVNYLLWKFFFGNRSLPEHYAEIYKANDSPVGVFIGSVPALILKDLEDVQTVMASDFQSFYKRGINTNPNDLLADNVLFIDDYKRWKILRNKLTPLFTTSKLKNMFYILDRCGKDFVDYLQNSKDIRDKPFNALYTYTTSSIGASVFGIDTGTKNTMDSPFLEMSWKAVEPSLKTNVKLVINGMCPTLFRLLKLRIFGEHEEFFIGAVKSVIESRRNATEKTHDFIEMCLELQKQGTMKDPVTGFELEPTTEVLAAQAFFFFIAGADTSANSMHFTLLCLASNQDWLAKVHKEIDSVFQDKDHLDFSDTEKLHILDMVVSESIRLYPTIGVMTRQCTKDAWLPGAKMMMEKGTVAVISAYGIHRDERFFPDPDLFDPERFAPNNLSNLKKYSYLPFGEGNRICIGK